MGTARAMTARWDRTKGRPEPIRALNRVRERECGEALVDLREAAPSVVVVRETTIPYAREEVARMVERAARSLPPGVRLGVTDAWRPIERQRAIYRWMERCLAEARPDLSPIGRRRILCRFVAPTDQKAPPGHCTGAALDVVLLGPDSEPLDLASPYDRLTGAPTYTFGLTESAQRNRTILLEAMLGAGFSNCRDEFWHYSFGDAGWAVRTGQTECRYGLAGLPDALWRECQDAWEAAMPARPNPFLSEVSRGS